MTLIFAVVNGKSVKLRTFDHIDPYSDRSSLQSTSRFAPRLNLTLEIYENALTPFQVEQITHIFDALQLTEKRVTDSLKLAIKNFPSIL